MARSATQVLEKLPLDLAVLSNTRGSYARALLEQLLSFSVGPRGDAVSGTAWRHLLKAAQVVAADCDPGDATALQRTIARASQATPGERQEGSVEAALASATGRLRYSLKVSAQVVGYLEQRGMPAEDFLDDDLDTRQELTMDFMWPRKFLRTPRVLLSSVVPELSISLEYATAKGCRFTLRHTNGRAWNSRVRAVPFCVSAYYCINFYGRIAYQSLGWLKLMLQRSVCRFVYQELRSIAF
jgi:hypothetical protein